MTDAPSPFIEYTNIQFAFDSTSLGDFKKCPRYYQYTMIEGWQPKDDNIHLRFGIEYHQALHDYELAKWTDMSHDEAVEVAVYQLLSRISTWDLDTTSKIAQKKNKHTLLRAVVWYLDKFKNDPAQTVEHLGKPALEVSFRWELDYGPQSIPETRHSDTKKGIVPDQHYVLCGHLDRIVNLNDDLYIMDRKTASSSLTSYYFSQFEPNNQMSLYSLAGQVVLKTPVKGVIIDAVQVKDEPEYQRSMTYRSPDQLTEWLLDLRDTLAYAERCAVNAYWPQNDTACTMYGGCRFKGVCSSSPAVRQRFLEADFVQKPKEQRWNPLANR